MQPQKDCLSNVYKETILTGITNYSVECSMLLTLTQPWSLSTIMLLWHSFLIIIIIIIITHPNERYYTSGRQRFTRNRQLVFFVKHISAIHECKLLTDYAKTVCVTNLEANDVLSASNSWECVIDGSAAMASSWISFASHARRAARRWASNCTRLLPSNISTAATQTYIHLV